MMFALVMLDTRVLNDVCLGWGMSGCPPLPLGRCLTDLCGLVAHLLIFCSLVHLLDSAARAHG